MKICLLSIALFMAACSGRTGGNKLSIGQLYGGKIDSTRFVLRNSGSIDTGYFVTIDGSVFTFCKTAGGLVNYLACSDPDFEMHGIRIGDTYGTVSRKFPQAMVQKERGWAVWLTLPSGWNAAFGLPNEDVGKAEIAQTAPVKWFFRR